MMTYLFLHCNNGLQLYYIRRHQIFSHLKCFPWYQGNHKLSENSLIRILNSRPFHEQIFFHTAYQILNELLLSKSMLLHVF